MFFIVGGLLFVFFGTKLVIYGFYALVFLLTSGVLFFGVYNMFLSTTASYYVVGGCAVVCMIVAGFAAYCGGKFFDKYGVALISLTAGIVVGVEITQVFSSKSLYIALGAIVGGGAGFYLGKALDLMAKSVTTSLIGAFLTVKGIKCYTTSVEDYEINGTKAAPYVELGCIIVLTVIGTIVQFKVLKREKADKDDDYMAAEDDNKCCGCF